MEQQIPLNSEASEGDTHKQTTTTLPPDVVQCLENARFVRLSAEPLPRTVPLGRLSDITRQWGEQEMVKPLKLTRCANCYSFTWRPALMTSPMSPS